MIDWTRPELYTHRERTDDEIVRVHVIPEWIKNSHYRVYIEWKSGECGWCLLNSDQIIPKPRKPRVVEGWTKEGFSRNGGWSFVVHQVEQVGERWVKVRVEEVTDEPA